MNSQYDQVYLIVVTMSELILAIKDHAGIEDSALADALDLKSLRLDEKNNADPEPERADAAELLRAFAKRLRSRQEGLSLPEETYAPLVRKIVGLSEKQ